ncbi:MAG: TerB family tellurite resistance protein [Xanthobacteraceae bacterium]|nr:TerB family tellurite resistance protein [Xanthobacteraceae bacterium]QYK44938.1 MAG: TerB family tellurite resistance protein [Xanthobacteraceae bacterium]HMN51632.1 TerB family tellurite resistance protein [Xanthobacteraceae bacterium]
MLQALSDLIGGFSRGGETKRFDESDYRLSAAALMVHVAISDDNFDDDEWTALHDALTQRFGIDSDDAAAFIESATVADREAIDLYQFTSQLNRSLDEDAKRKLIEVLFAIGYADGKLSEFEDNIVWRASELLHVSPEDRVEIRRRIRAASGDRG